MYTMYFGPILTLYTLLLPDASPHIPPNFMSSDFFKVTY